MDVQLSGPNMCLQMVFTQQNWGIESDNSEKGFHDSTKCKRSGNSHLPRGRLRDLFEPDSLRVICPRVCQIKLARVTWQFESAILAKIKVLTLPCPRTGAPTELRTHRFQ